MINVNRNIIRDVPVLAGIYAGQFDCEIRIGGGKAFASDKMIQIPYPKEETLNLTWCFVVHEAAHIRFTDFSQLKKWLDGKPKHERKFFKNLLNIVEDTYIEKLILTLFPGSYEYLEAGGKYLADKMLEEEVTAENALSRFIFLYVRGNLTGYRALQASYTATRKKCILHFGLPLIQKLSRILEQTLSSTCTHDNCEIVDEFVGFLENPTLEEDNSSKNDTDQPQSDESSTDNEGEQPDSSEQSDDSEEDSGSSSEQGDDTNSDDDSTGSSEQGGDTGSDDDSTSSSEECGESTDDTAQNSNQNHAGAAPDGKDEWTSEEVQIAIKSAMERLAESETDTGDMIKEVIEDDENIDWDASAELGSNFSTVVSKVHQQPLNIHNTLSQDTSQATAALKQKLAALVAHKTRTKKTVEKRGRRFARGKVHRLTVGNPAIFSRKTRDERKPNSSIVILVDDSGSIGNHLPDMQKATLALIDSLDTQKGVKVAAIAFGSEFGGNGELTRLKSFSERGDIVANRVASLTANGHTPLLNGLKAAKQDLHGVKNRKLVIVLTDGQPNDLKCCIDFMKEMQNSSIDLVGVGIGKGVDVSSMQAQYGHSNYTLVPQFEYLPQAVMELSKHIMLD